MPYAGEYVLGAGFCASNAGCDISIELDKKEGRAWTGGYYFHLDETAIASCKEAAGWEKNTPLSEMMTRLRDEILDSGQYKEYEIPSGFQIGSRRGVAYMTSEDKNIRSHSSDPLIHMSDSDRRGRVTKRPFLNVALRQPLEQIRTTGCSFWPLTARLKALLWDPIMKTAAPRIYEETTRSQQG